MNTAIDMMNTALTAMNGAVSGQDNDTGAVTTTNSTIANAITSVETAVASLRAAIGNVNTTSTAKACDTLTNTDSDKKFTDTTAADANIPNPDPKTATPTSRLLNLPVEIKKQIVSFLFTDHRPNLAVLRRTHSSFLNIIPKSELRKSRGISHLCKAQMAYAQRFLPYLLPKGYGPCFTCGKLNYVSITQRYYPQTENILAALDIGALDGLLYKVCYECHNDRPRNVTAFHLWRKVSSGEVQEVKRNSRSWLPKCPEHERCSECELLTYKHVFAKENPEAFGKIYRA